MQICRVLAGYSYGQADLVRRAMAKKKHDVMEKEREYFLYGKKAPDGTTECIGAVANGVDEQTAISIFDEMSSFASYAFNKDVYKRQEHGIPLTLVGNGSNLLVSDTGIPGCVLHLGNLFSNITLEENNIVCCEAGASLAKACVFAQKFALSGLEFAYGIPGSVGGAAYMLSLIHI